MKQAGEMLKSARESKKLSLHEIGMSLKINPKILQAIEDGDMTKLPQKTFLRGFIKSYALYLRLDATAVLKASEIPSAAPVANPVASAPTPEIAVAKPAAAAAVDINPLQEMRKALPTTNVDRTARLDNLKTPAPTPRKGLYIVLIVVLFAMVGAVYRMVNKYQRERNFEHPAVATAPPATENLPDPTATPLPVTEVAATPPAATPTPPPPPAPPTPTLAIVPGNILPPAAPVSTKAAEVTEPVKAVTKEEPKAEKASTKTTASAAATATTTNTPAATTGKTEGKPQEVIVEALNKVQIQFNLGDGKTESIELNADEIHTFKSKSSVHLDISDGGAVSIIINGRDRGVPGKIGKPISLQYPK